MIISSDAELFLSKLLNANLNQLIDLKREAIEWPFPYFMYHSVMIAYLKNDIEELKSLVASFEREWITPLEVTGDISPNKRDLENFYWLSQARLCVRQNENIERALENLTKVMASHSLWRAELYFVRGLLYGGKHQYELEKESFYHSYTHFIQSGAKRKALLALQNSIAAESSMFPNKRFTVEYYHLMNLALKHKIYSTAGLCALNLSREYKKMKAYLVSLKMASLAVKLLKQDFGTQHYGLSLCHRAEVLFEMGRFHEAKLDLDEAKSIEFVEVRNA